MTDVRLVYVQDVPMACQWLYELLRERSEENDPFVNISHRKLPTPEEHARFFANPPYFVWQLIKVIATGDTRGTVTFSPESAEEWVRETYVGYICATFQNEIGIQLLPQYRGKGYGGEALRLFMATHKPLLKTSARVGAWLANINPRNERSIRMFTSAGFNLVQKTYKHDPNA